MNDKSILDSVKNMYPDFSEDKAKALVMRTLAWTTVLGSTITQKIEDAKTKGTDDVEERAVILGLALVARVIADKYEAEADQLSTLLDCLLTLETEIATAL